MLRELRKYFEKLSVAVASWHVCQNRGRAPTMQEQGVVLFIPGITTDEPMVVQDPKVARSGDRKLGFGVG